MAKWSETMLDLIRRAKSAKKKADLHNLLEEVAARVLDWQRLNEDQAEELRRAVQGLGEVRNENKRMRTFLQSIKDNLREFQIGRRWTLIPHPISGEPLAKGPFLLPNDKPIEVTEL